jgi:hypothetical protein
LRVPSLPEIVWLRLIHPYSDDDGARFSNIVGTKDKAAAAMASAPAFCKIDGGVATEYGKGLLREALRWRKPQSTTVPFWLFA